MPNRIDVLNNPVNYFDPYGLWTFSGGFGLGYAVTVKVGYNSGRVTLGIGAGEGFGAIANFDSTTKADNGVNAQINISVSGNIKVGSKSLGVGIFANAGADACDNYENKAGATLSLPGPMGSSFDGGTFEVGERGNVHTGVRDGFTNITHNPSIGIGAFQFAGANAEVTW